MKLRFYILVFFITLHSIYAKALIFINDGKSFTYIDENNQSHQIYFNDEIDGNLTYIAVIRHESNACSQCVAYLVGTDSGKYFLRFEERALGYFVPVVSCGASLSSMQPFVTHMQGENSLLQLPESILGVKILKDAGSAKTGRIITIPVSVNKLGESDNSIELIKNDSSEKIEGKMQIIEKLTVTDHI